MVARNAKTFTYRFTTSRQRTTPKRACWWRIKSARRDGRATPSYLRRLERQAKNGPLSMEAFRAEEGGCVADAAAPCGIRRLGESSWKQRFPQRTSSSDSFGHKTRRRNCAGPSTALFFGFSVHFADLHILVNGERGIADGRTRGGRS